MLLPFDSKIALKSGGEDSDKLTRIKSDYGFELQYSRNHFHLKKVAPALLVCKQSLIYFFDLSSLFLTEIDRK